MSKSLKNTLSIEHFLNTHSADEFRMLCLMSRYRNSIEYSDAAMNNASNICKKIESFFHTCDAYIKGQLDRGLVIEENLLKELEKTKKEMREVLSDDFNTSKALSSVLDLVSTTNTMLNDKTEDTVRNAVPVAAVSNFVNDVFCKLGLKFDKINMEMSKDSSILLNCVLDAAVDFRCKVRETVQVKGQNVVEDVKKQKKDIFNHCDNFRDNLNDLGIQLEDHGKKSSWKFKEKVKNVKHSNIK